MTNMGKVKEITAVYTVEWLNSHPDVKAKTYSWQYGNEPDAVTTALSKVFELFAVLVKGGLESVTVSC